MICLTYCLYVIVHLRLSFTISIVENGLFAVIVLSILARINGSTVNLMGKRYFLLIHKTIFNASMIECYNIYTD
jgi:hypothetical protein